MRICPSSTQQAKRKMSDSLDNAGGEFFNLSVNLGCERYSCFQAEHMSQIRECMGRKLTLDHEYLAV